MSRAAVINLAKSEGRSRADQRQQPSLGLQPGRSTKDSTGVPPVPAARLLRFWQRTDAVVRTDASAPRITGLHPRLDLGVGRCHVLFPGQGNDRGKVQGRPAAAQGPSEVSNRFTPKILSAIVKQNRRNSLPGLILGGGPVCPTELQAPRRAAGILRAGLRPIRTIPSQPGNQQLFGRMHAALPGAIGVGSSTGAATHRPVAPEESLPARCLR